MNLSAEHHLVKLQNSPQKEYQCETQSGIDDPESLNHSDHFHLALRIVVFVLQSVQSGTPKDSVFNQLFQFFHPDWTLVPFGKPKDLDSAHYQQMKQSMVDIFYQHLKTTYCDPSLNFTSCEYFL